MAKSPNKIFKHHKYILDGDSKKRFKNKKRESNICFLPSNYGVEVIMFHFIRALNDPDGFWDSAHNLTKQTCFVDYQDNGKQSNAKNWFNDKDLKEDFFGRSYSKLFNRWKKDNTDLVDEFRNELRQTL